MAEEHKRLNLGASAWHRWGTCLGSPGFIIRNADALPPDTSSAVAEEGTLAHLYAEEVLRDGFTFTEVSPEMAGNVDRYISFVQAQDGERHVELKNPLPYQPDRNTIADSVVWHTDSKTLFVNDLKYGMMRVQSQGNFQLLIGAAAVVKAMKVKPKKFVLTIAQPRLDGEPEPWELTAKEFAGHWATVESTALFIRANLDRDLPLVPTNKGCRYCPAKGICPAFNGTSFLPLIDSGVAALTPLEKAKLAANEKLIKSAVDEAVKECRAALKEGRADLAPGLELVPVRKGSLSYVDADAAAIVAARTLGEEAFKKSLITPKQLLDKLAEAGLNCEEFEPLIERGEPAMGLRPTGDLNLSLEVSNDADLDAFDNI